jgi:hypothetical protein
VPRGRTPRTAVHERLAQEVKELRERLGGLPRPAEAEEIWKGIWIHEAHNSTAIEGNTLVLREVEKLLSEMENLMRFVIPAVAGPLRLVPLEALSMTEVSVRALRAAAERGRLRAQRGDDRVWRSTRRWVDDYLAGRYASLRAPRGRAASTAG